MNENTFQKYMTDIEIVDLIKRYIERSSYNYAVLIDGSWGCGKTFFIKETLIPSLEKLEKEKLEKDTNYKVKKIIYISLYGVTSKEEITKKIIIETLPFKNFVKSKGFGIASYLGKTVVGGILSTQGVSLPDNSINLSDFVAVESCILVFDDLERCGMNINDTLGYINEFIEHDGIKCIIIANEKEIATTNRVRNKELKYLVALNKDIEYPQDEKKNESPVSSAFNQQTNQNTDQKSKLECLSKKVNILFGEDELYNQIKEKLIGMTINYKPEIIDVIDKVLAQNCTYENIKNIIIENQEFIAEKFNYYKHHNIRTLLFCFDKFITIYDSLSGKIAAQDEKIVFNEIFKYTVAISIKHKMGKSLPKWKGNNEIEEMSLDNIYESQSYIKRFKFVDEFVFGASFQKEKSIEVIKRHLEIKSRQIIDPDDPFFKLDNGWWHMEDSEAKNLILTINKILKDDPKKYKVTSYSKILYLNIVLKRLKVIDINIDDILQTMINNLSSLEVEDTFNTFGWNNSSFEDKEDTDYFSKCIEMLSQEVKYNKEKNNTEGLNSVFKDGENWADQLNKFVNERENEFLNQKGFISKMDFNKLLSAIIQSPSNDITTFRRIILHSIYKFSNINEYYMADKEPIQNLRDEIEIYYKKIKDKEKLRAHNLKYLIDNLNNILERLE
jgi:hypothetical protein